jgi:hypothetical protein
MEKLISKKNTKGIKNRRKCAYPCLFEVFQREIQGCKGNSEK